MIRTVHFRRSFIALISAAVIISLGSFPRAQTYNVSIDVTPLKIANPGELVTHVFTVKNQGTSADTYDLTLILPEGWTSLPVPDQLTVSSGGSKPVFANVNVPNNAGSKEYNIKLTAQSSGNPSVEATKAAAIRVKSVPGFDLEWVEEPAGLGPGVTAQGKFKVSNTGNLPDRYNITISQPGGWSFSMKEEKIQLMPGQSRTLSAAFTVPEDGRVGSRYRLEITVTSEHDRQLEKSITASDQLTPPPPEKVERSLYPDWDIFTSTSANQNGNPSFSISGNGDIPGLGEISTGLDLSVDGFQGGSLQVMKDRWGFSLNGSISGSYVGVGGGPLIMGEFADITSRFIFTEESKGISLEKEGEYWELRAILGSEGTKREIEFHELQGVYEFSNGVVLDGLITTASTQTQSGTIVEAGLEFSDNKFDIYPSFLKVYPNYPTQSPKVAAGVDVSYEEDEFTSFFNWDYNRTRLGEDPNYYHSQEHDFDVGTSLDLGDYLGSNVMLGFTWRKSDDDPVSNDLYANSFTANIFGGDKLSWSLGTSYSRTADYVSDTVVSTHSIDGSLSFSLGNTEHSTGVSLSKTEDPSGTSITNTFTFSSSFDDAPLSPTFSLSKGGEDTTLSAGFSEESSSGLSLNISFSASLVKQDSVSLSVSSSFPDPFRVCGPTKGQVKGHVFIDENQNGKRDEGEQAINGGILTLDAKKAISGDTGKFAFPPVKPGSYRLDLEKAKAGFDPTIQLPLEVSVVAGEIKEIPVPLGPRTWVRGTVYNDKNQNGSRESNESGMSGILFSVTGKGTTRDVRSGANGVFTIDLTPGKYRVKLDESSLPERYEPTTPATVEIDTKGYGRTEVSFGVYQKPKPVVVTFGPPTAKFSHSPEKPTLGENVRFNATESSAIETTIESYKWEFIHEETVIKREGKTINVDLEQTGVWEVSLTVTDKNGLKGKAVKSFRVIEN